MVAGAAEIGEIAGRPDLISVGHDTRSMYLATSQWPDGSDEKRPVTAQIITATGTSERVVPSVFLRAPTCSTRGRRSTCHDRR
jgi:hypothetical protein